MVKNIGPGSSYYARFGQYVNERSEADWCFLFFDGAGNLIQFYILDFSRGCSFPKRARVCHF